MAGSAWRVAARQTMNLTWRDGSSSHSPHPEPLHLAPCIPFTHTHTHTLRARQRTVFQPLDKRLGANMRRTYPYLEAFIAFVLINGALCPIDRFLCYWVKLLLLLIEVQPYFHLNRSLCHWRSHRQFPCGAFPLAADSNHTALICFPIFSSFK